MPNMTLSLPEELYRRIKRYPELKWSEIARQAFENKLDEIEMINRMLAKSKLTEAEAGRIAHRIKSKIRKRIE